MTTTLMKTLFLERKRREREAKRDSKPNKKTIADSVKERKVEKRTSKLPHSNQTKTTSMSQQPLLKRRKKRKVMDRIMLLKSHTQSKLSTVQVSQSISVFFKLGKFR